VSNSELSSAGKSLSIQGYPFAIILSEVASNDYIGSSLFFGATVNALDIFIGLIGTSLGFDYLGSFTGLSMS
jgi:hypothetical protein